jgi:hypothetical protein
MNQQLLEILSQRDDFRFSDEDRKILKFFVEYMDHSSLWLFSYEAGEDGRFIFTNEAQHFTFTMSQIRSYYNDMKSGVPMDWEKIPFEYITKI